MKEKLKGVNRREALLSLGVVAGGLASLNFARAQQSGSKLAATPAANPLGVPKQPEWRKPQRPVTAVVIGAGMRGHIYASYAETHPEELKIVGVAEPIASRNEDLATRHKISSDHRWNTWERVFDGPKFCDAVIITTPDHLHYGPAMAALEKGYDVLLEKAIAQSWSQCNAIRKLSRKKGAIVGIGHVMRYAPYWQMMKHVIDSGRIGQIVSIQHIEPVSHIHMSHSFVRGNWRNTKESNPMLLSKSCHDLDMMRWLVGKPCRRVQSFGSLRLFRKENAPPGAPARCTDGCPAEKECSYSALDIYYRRKTWLVHKDTPGNDDASIMEWLKRTNYGRCVFHCDNDVVDHQIVNMEFEGGITVAFSMEGLTSVGGRRTRVIGTAGDIYGDEKVMEVADFRAKATYRWVTQEHAKDLEGHGGGDFRLARDWVQAISWRNPNLLTSTIEASMESHLIGFTAEASRLDGGTLKKIDPKALQV